MENFNIFIILFFANLICLINGNFTCKEADPIVDMDAEKLSGIWYGIVRNPTIYDVTFKCSTYNMSTLPSDALFLDLNTVNLYSENPIRVKIYLKYDTDKKTGSFKVHIKEEGINDIFDINIIAADYDDYVIYQGCNYKREIEYVWVVARERIIEDDRLEQLNELLEEKGVKSKFLRKMSQDDCNN